MAGFRIDVEWLTQYSSDVRAAGEEVGVGDVRLSSEAFGELGRRVGAEESYGRVTELLSERTALVGEVLVAAGDELRRVVDFHTGGDDDNARELAREPGV